MIDFAPTILRFPGRPADEDPIVITGIGIAASVGASRESVWKAVQGGRSGIRLTNAGDHVGSLELPCGMVDWLPENSTSVKSVQISERIAAEAPQGERPLVSVILDGENAWEHYPYNAYYFLQALYQALETHPSIRPTTYAAFLRECSNEGGAPPALGPRHGRRA